MNNQAAKSDRRWPRFARDQQRPGETDRVTDRHAEGHEVNENTNKYELYKKTSLSNERGLFALYYRLN